jgi:hypothetical protein
MTSSPWSKAGAPSVTLPPPPSAPPLAPTPGVPSPAAGPFPGGFPLGRAPRRRVSPWTVIGLVVTVIVSAVITATVTIVTMRSNTAHQYGQPSAPPTAPASAAPTPQVSPTESAAAKAHLCQVFDVSVRGQQGKGGLRVEGNLNVPVVLRSVNSALAVQAALVPAVPADVTSAAHTYVQTTLDATTAAMGNTSTDELNRLNDVSNDAINALLDACGLPR